MSERKTNVRRAVIKRLNARDGGNWPLWSLLGEEGEKPSNRLLIFFRMAEGRRRQIMHRMLAD